MSIDKSRTKVLELYRKEDKVEKNRKKFIKTLAIISVCGIINML